MSATIIRLPRVSVEQDFVDTFTDFHQALRDVAAWIPSIIDEAGAGSPRDARWLRAFLNGPLVWHFADEENVLVPWLSLRQSHWLDACLARTCNKHQDILEHARELAALIEPLCAGEPIPRLRFMSVAQRFARAIEDDVRYEDDILLPSARLFLDASERAAIAKDITASDEARAWLDVAVAHDVSEMHRVHAVRTRNAAGLDIIRSFADCPRRRAINVESCAGCPQLGSIHVDCAGTGQVACAIEETRAAKELCVGDIMTRDIVCIENDAPLAEAARLLAASCISGLPVVDERGRAVGVVSQSDIVGIVAKTGGVANHLVRDVMMHMPIVVRENDTVDDAARLLILEGIHRLPVINADRAVVGIVTTLDLLRATVARPRSAGGAA